jgi:hypothetical protein
MYIDSKDKQTTEEYGATITVLKVMKHKAQRMTQLNAVDVMKKAGWFTYSLTGNKNLGMRNSNDPAMITKQQMIAMSIDCNYDLLKYFARTTRP